jgi:gamma-glutamylcyclotransferase (GGCT)/AIG2-like uncharacterized protein YtfP
MRLFLYGTLLDPRTLAERAGEPGLGTRLSPAVLRGWRRVQTRDRRYPTLARNPAGEVRGAVLCVPAEARRRLHAYEGPGYRLVRVIAESGGGPVPAHAWIASPATRRTWRS